MAIQENELPEARGLQVIQMILHGGTRELASMSNRAGATTYLNQATKLFSAPQGTAMTLGNANRLAAASPA